MRRTIPILCLLLLPLGWAVAEDSGPDARPARVLEGVSQLVAELDNDEFEVRRRAAAALEELVSRPELGPLLSAEFRRRLSRLDISFEVRWHLRRWCARLPEVEHSPGEKLAPAELDQLVANLGDDSFGVRAGAAERLESLLEYEEHLSQVRAALQSRLQEKSDPETASQIKRLLEMGRRAMVAECWREHRHVGEQHLLVDVPSMGPGAIRASHFDRINDRVAHCVSGNNLSRGEYPVGVAFPHPNDPCAFFHLVNLPTPRRRRVYAEYVKTDEKARLVVISRRTLDRMLQEKKKLSEREIVMLSQLDYKEMSRFADKYFHLVDDEPLPREQAAVTSFRPTRFGLICANLASFGTKEAVPGLLAAIEKGRFLPPTATSQHRFQWLAALSIARRDPWPQVDSWLAAQIANRELLVWGHDEGPEVGATAAVLLLQRYSQPAEQFGLQVAVERVVKSCRVDGYRFTSDEARGELQQWWQRRTSP